MSGGELLVLVVLAILIVAPGPASLIDIRSNLRHGYVPVGWLKRDRVMRADRPVLFWLLTKGRLLLLTLALVLLGGLFLVVV
jgi:hypothetical protein